MTDISLLETLRARPECLELMMECFVIDLTKPLKDLEKDVSILTTIGQALARPYEETQNITFSNSAALTRVLRHLIHLRSTIDSHVIWRAFCQIGDAFITAGLPDERIKPIVKGMRVLIDHEMSTGLEELTLGLVQARRFSLTEKIVQHLVEAIQENPTLELRWTLKKITCALIEKDAPQDLVQQGLDVLCQRTSPDGIPLKAADRIAEAIGSALSRKKDNYPQQYQQVLNFLNTVQPAPAGSAQKKDLQP